MQRRAGSCLLFFALPFLNGYPTYTFITRRKTKQQGDGI
jgi:hypothetical protein